MVASRALQEQPPSWLEAIRVGMLVAHTWGLFSLVIARIVRRFPIDRNFLWPGAIIHLLALFFFIFAYASLYAAVFVQSELPDSSLVERIGYCLQMTFHSQVLFYCVITAIHYVIDFKKRTRAREQQLAQMQVELTQAKLDKLRSQLQPHFLFNTMNTITSLIVDNPQGAILVTTRLSELLRIALDRSDEDKTALHEELEFVQKYLEIQQIRFGSRLAYSESVPDELRAALVPTMVLQTLAENAVRHGVAASSAECQVAIKAARVTDKLEIEIVDGGPGCPSFPDPSALGIGLNNTKKRLQHLYGDDSLLHFASAPNGGTCVRLTVPLQFSDSRIS